MESKEKHMNKVSFFMKKNPRMEKWQLLEPLWKEELLTRPMLVIKSWNTILGRELSMFLSLNFVLHFY
jgi:hypothetical protein